MTTLFFWCGVAIVSSITLALCAAIVGSTFVSVKKMIVTDYAKKKKEVKY